MFSHFSAFTCHEHGCPALVYAPHHQLLISGGRKGEICIFDIRQRQLRHTFQAHEAAVRCIAIDTEEDYFVTGSSEGDVKVSYIFYFDIPCQQCSWWAPVFLPKTSKFFSFFKELYSNNFKNLIRTRKFKFSFRGLSGLEIGVFYCTFTNRYR